MAATKRTRDQIKRDRARVAELALQHHTDIEIRDILYQETGIHLSQQQINADRQKVRKMWQEKQHEHIDMLMTRELQRLDVLEREIWRALRHQLEPKETKEIEKMLPKLRDAADFEDVDLVISKMKTTVKQHAANAAYFAQIADCQKERRKLLGLYAPQQIGINKTVVVKGYTQVSPEDWPAVIEGEVINNV